MARGSLLKSRGLGRLGLRVRASKLWVQCQEFRISGSRLGVLGQGFKVNGKGKEFWVEYSGLLGSELVISV